ncbi:MAG: hypothetical protein GF368_03235 [Candidatus Aenigmarchaeota archaeon]|nr:hypothetical protein [Candidatus Aenigmarchaeota archaeon]
MAEKRWSDYWKKYKSDEITKKPTKSYKKKERPTIKITPKVPKISGPKTNVNFKSIFTVMLALTVLGLGVWQFRSARMIETLEEEELSLECELGNCTEQLSTLNSTLNSCTSNLESCTSDLTDKLSDLNSCESTKTNINEEFSMCEDELLEYRRDYSDLEDDYNDCQDVLDDKKDDLSSCQNNLDDKRSDYNKLKSNYQDLCNANCAQDCTFDSGNEEYECPNATTTTSTTTTVSTTTTTT